MADAVYGPCLPNSQSDAGVRLEGTASQDFEAVLLRFENNRKSLQSAAAIFANGSRALIDQLKTTKTNAAAPQQGGAELRLHDAAIDLTEIANFVQCAQLAARNVGDRDDGEALSTLLGHILTEMERLSEALRPEAEADA